MSKANEQTKTNKQNVNWRHTLSMLAVAVLIFGLGYGVGKGNIKVGPFSKTVSQDLPNDLNYDSVEQVYDSLKANYDGQLTQEELLDGLKNGLAKASGDPYTEYFNPEAAKDFDEQLSGTFSGIGAELSKDKELITVIAPIAGYPAEKAGLRPKDVIVEIDGQSAYDLGVTEAVNKIRGPEGTKVKLKVVRGGSETLDFEITRQQITIPSVTYEVINGNIGYMKISRFSDDTAKLARQAANSFKQQNVKGVIVDLRSNPGGFLDAAVDLSSLWLDKGKKVLDEKRDGVVVKSYTASGNGILKGIPTVVLINEGSASASEITAGALKDNGVARLIGDKSFGKGSVQSLINLGDDSVLKVTIARWFTPSGKNIDKEGIEPDQEIKRSGEDITAGRDPQRDAALEFLKK